MSVSALHEDCVACRAVAEPLAPACETLVLLAMLRAGHEPAEIHRDLCFAHRRSVELAAEAILAEGLT